MPKLEEAGDEAEEAAEHYPEWSPCRAAPPERVTEASHRQPGAEDEDQEEAKTSAQKDQPNKVEPISPKSKAKEHRHLSSP